MWYFCLTLEVDFTRSCWVCGGVCFDDVTDFKPSSWDSTTFPVVSEFSSAFLLRDQVLSHWSILIRSFAPYINALHRHIPEVTAGSHLFWRKTVAVSQTGPLHCSSQTMPQNKYFLILHTSWFDIENNTYMSQAVWETLKLKQWHLKF